MKISFVKVKQLTFLFLILMFVTAAISVLPGAKARMTILSMDPASGSVGTYVQLRANTTTTSGKYEVRFDEILLEEAGGNASLGIINASFIVPQAVAGNHTVTVTDVETGENATSTFTVLTSYTLTVHKPETPGQIQEGDSIPVSVNITGGESDRSYVANITVQTPANVSYAKMANVSTTSIGSGNETVDYPDEFSIDANSQYVGDYKVLLNSTFDVSSFYVGLTNSTEYHRNQTVDIQALYKPNENVTLTITGRDLHEFVNLTADSTGMVSYTNFTVPLNATIGSYRIDILSASADPTVKNPPDIQNFTVPGFTVNVTAKNLAQDPVSNVQIRAFENMVSVGNASSDSEGLAAIKLELGNYTLEAHFKDQKVGERTAKITGATSLDFICELTNLKIHVIALFGGANISIPDAQIHLFPDNVTIRTNINGNAIAHSLLPNVTYSLNVSRYNVSFKEVTTIQQLLMNETAVAWYNVTITCPTLTLGVNITKPNGEPIRDVVVKIQESMGGLRSENTTGPDGTVIFNSAFGKYHLQVFSEAGVSLNETIVELFQNQSVVVICNLFDLTISIRVVDYFGQPLSNTNVALQQEGLSPILKTTQLDGLATFNIDGGKFGVFVYINNQTHPIVSREFTIEDSTAIELRIEQLTLLAGFLVQTRLLAIVIASVLFVVFIISLEIYRRKFGGAQKE